VKNPFKSQGFDSIIGPSTTIVGAVDVYGTMMVDGKIVGTEISGKDGTVFVNGSVDVEIIRLANLTICGVVSVKEVFVTGVLAVKKGAALEATNIHYTTLVIEPGAAITGNLQRLDQSTAASAA
jgi:cytoskeletal protein CcmA (bactofilin family)